MPSKYGIYAEDFDNWREKRHTPEYARHLARCGKYISPYTAMDIAHMKLDAYNSPKELLCGYYPSQRRNEWALNTNQNCSTSDEENQKDIKVKQKTTRKTNGLTRDDRVRLWSNNDSSYTSLKGTYEKSRKNRKSAAASVAESHLHTQSQHIAGVSSQGQVNHVKTIIEKHLPSRKCENLTETYDTKSMGTINIGARARRRAAFKIQDKLPRNESKDFANGRCPPVSMKQECEMFDNRVKLRDSVAQAQYTPASKPSATKQSSPIKPFARFCMRRELSIPLKPTFPKSSSEYPQELTDHAAEILALGLHFSTNVSVKDDGEFPFELDVQEKRLQKGESHTGRSEDMVVKCFTKDRLELHGTMRSEDSTVDQSSKFILIVKPGRTADGQVEYKGVYRRQLAEGPKYISWSFHL